MTAIKSVALLILLLALAMAAGIAGCKAAGANAHVREMVPAFLLALAASAVAMVPLLAQRGKLDTTGAFQAALIGTVLHLGLILIVAVVMLMMKRVTTPFVLWLLAGYWSTLIGLCVMFAKMIRSAPKAFANGN